MKGLYISTYVITKESCGVSKKIKAQIKAFEEANIEMTHLSIHAENIVFKILSKILGLIVFLPNFYTIKLWFSLRKFNINDFDFIYIRKSSFDFMTYKIFEDIKKKNGKVKILLEIPTYPYDMEYYGVLKKMLLRKDIKSRQYYIKFVDRILTYSNHKEIFNIKTINISNAIDLDVMKAKKSDTETNGINIIAVAMFSPWHGYERFIRGLWTYYNKSKSSNEFSLVYLHLVGDGPELIKYKQLVRDLNLNDKVFFHGPKYGNDLDIIYDKCDIGLDALARHRSGVYYNSSLKGKEYCAKGLPIISGVETELDKDENYEYYMRVDACEDDINICKIIDFYNAIYKSGKSKEDIIKIIRKYAIEKFSFRKLLSPVIHYINNDA